MGLNDLTKQRRKHFLWNEPESPPPLLKEDLLFSAEESEKLFGGRFLDAMLKEVEDEAKFNSMGCTGESSSNPKPAFPNRQHSAKEVAHRP